MTTGTDGTVIRFDPAAGTEVDSGSSVNLVLRNLPASTLPWEATLTFGTDGSWHGYGTPGYSGASLVPDSFRHGDTTITIARLDFNGQRLRLWADSTANLHLLDGLWVRVTTDDWDRAAQLNTASSTNERINLNTFLESGDAIPADTETAMVSITATDPRGRQITLADGTPYFLRPGEAWRF